MSDVTFKIGDQVTVKDHPTVGTITETKFFKNEVHFLVNRAIGSGRMSHWLRAADLHLIEAAASLTPLEASRAALCPFKVGDKVRSTGANYDGKVRIVQGVNIADDGSVILTVRKDEAAGAKSPLWSWMGEFCELVESVTSSDPAQVDPVAYDLKETESDADSDPLFRAAQALADEMDKTAAAEERAKVAELRVSKLEAKLREMEACITQLQPVPVAQAECYQIKTEMFQVMKPEHDKQYADYLNQGWKENSVTSVIGSDDTIYSVVVFKKMFTTPTQPSRGTASAAAGLTSPFVSQEMYRARQQQAVESDAILEPVNSKREIKLGPIGSSIKKIGAEATGRLMTDFALEKAFAAGRERIAAMPDFNRPLHTLKASN